MSYLVCKKERYRGCLHRCHSAESEGLQSEQSALSETRLYLGEVYVRHLNCMLWWCFIRRLAEDLKRIFYLHSCDDNEWSEWLINVKIATHSVRERKVLKSHRSCSLLLNTRLYQHLALLPRGLYSDLHLLMDKAEGFPVQLKNRGLIHYLRA